jgi:hypothetical protein
MTVDHRDGGWVVVEDKHVLAGPFETHAEAWRWIDRHDGQSISPHENRSQWSWDRYVQGR